MVRSPVKLKESKWSYLRKRPRLYSRPTDRPFTVTWQDSMLEVPENPQSLSPDAVPPSYSTSLSSSKEAMIQHTSEVLRHGCDSELDEDPLPPFVRTLLLMQSSKKASSTEPLSNLQPRKPVELLNGLRLDDGEHSPKSECSREGPLVTRAVLTVASECQAAKSENLPGKKISWFQGFKNRHSDTHHMDSPKSSSSGNEKVATAETHMSDGAYMSHSHSPPVTHKIQIKERTPYYYGMGSHKSSSFGKQQGASAKQCASVFATFMPQVSSTPIAPMKNRAYSLPVELSPVLVSRTAPPLKAPVSSGFLHAARHAQQDIHSEEGSPVIPKLQESGRTKMGKRDAQCGTDSPVVPKHQEYPQTKKPRMDTHAATLGKHAQRKKHKKFWVQVQLYDHPNGQRSKSDMNMYDIYLSLALEMIEEQRQHCLSEKEKKVLKQFYEEVTKDTAKIIDEVQVYTDELFELRKEVLKMKALRKKLKHISHELEQLVKENNIQGLDPFQFFCQEEVESEA